MTGAAHRFAATIGITGVNPYVDVPEPISRNLGGRRHIPVAMTIDGHPFAANLVPLGGGRFRLYLNGVMRKAAGKDVGDRVTIGLSLDKAPRIEPIRPELAAALAENPAAAHAFEGLSPSRQKEILRYLNRLQKPESVARSVDRVIRVLHGETDVEGAVFARPRPTKAD